MAGDNWQIVREIFDAAIRRKPEERSNFVREACGNDKSLLVEVESLLSSLGSADSFLETPVISKVADIIQSESQLLERGQIVGHYEIIKQIGEGGMGEIFLAKDTNLNRKVALKLLAAHITEDKNRVSRFRQEAFATSALNHPNIVTIHEIGKWQGRDFIVTEFVDGMTLRAWLKKRKPSAGEALDVALQVASALSAAHGAGIVHRDIKPENIMIREDNLVKVLDFGIAKYRSTENGRKALVETEAGEIIGTAAYMSPEQARGLEVDAQTDIWSLGVILYEMLAGRLPFQGSTKSDRIAAILERDPAPLAKTGGKASPQLQQIVDRALAKEKKQRYANMEQVAEELYLLRETTGEKRKSPFILTGGKPSSFRRSYLFAAIALISLIVGAIALGVYFFDYDFTRPLSEKDTILLADFVNTTGDPVFDQTLKQALAVQLEQTPFLNIYPDDRIQETLRLMNRTPDERITKEIAREICERSGIRAMLLGSIASLGNNYVITLEASNPQTGGALAREQIEAAGKEQVLGKIGEAARKLREKLGESLQSIERFDAPVEQATTSSLEALKAYSTGLEMQNRHGKPIESIPFHKRAIELDPNFASAHQLLGIAYWASGQPDLSAEPFTKAFELRERVSQREKFNISAHYYWHVVGDIDKTVEALELWKQTYPREWLPRSDLAMLYHHVGQYEKTVEEAQEAIRLNPHALPYFHLGVGFMGLNRLEEAKAAFEEALARGQDSIFTRVLLYHIAFIEGDRARMQQQVDWARGKPYERRMHYEEGTSAMFYGQISRAEKSFARAIEPAEQRDGKAPAGTRPLPAFVIWNAFFGNCTGTKTGIALALCGEINQAQIIADEIAKRKYKDVVNISDLPEMQAAIEISRNNPAKAIELLEATRILERGFGIPERATYLRGIAYLRQNAGTEAMNEFQKILERRGQVATSPFFPLAHLGLARAAAIAGDTTKSRRAYQDFFALWKDADPNIPILIEAKQEYDKLK